MESIDAEAGRTVFANYLYQPPGDATLTYFWSQPAVATQAPDGIWTYRLTIQKQPGSAPEPLELRLRLPAGAAIVDTSDRLAVDEDLVRLTTTLTQDLELEVRYTVSEVAEDG